MRTETVTYVSFDELPPERQATVVEAERAERHASYEAPLSDEIRDSYGAIMGHIGPVGDCADLSGRRAHAWLENVVLGPLRIPYRGARRWKLARYGRWYRPGMVEPCPLTGVCYDDDLLGSLRRDIAAGHTVGDAVRWLEDCAVHLLRAEWEAYLSDESIREDLSARGDEWKL